MSSLELRMLIKTKASNTILGAVPINKLVDCASLIE